MCVLGIVLVAYKELVWNRAIWDLMWSSLRKHGWFCGLLLVVVVAKFDYVLLAWSAHYLDISVTTVAFELYHIAWIFVLSKISGQYRKLTPWTYVLLIIAFLGVGFVVMSQSDATHPSSFRLLDLANGFGLVAGAILLGAFWVIAFKFGDNLEKEWKKNGENTESVALFGTLFASILGSFIASIFCFVVGGFRESISFEFTFIVVLVPIIMGVGHGIADSLYRLGNLVNRSLGINAITYLSPLLALVWLFAFSQVEVSRVDYLIIGAAAIITANLLINFEAEMGWCFKALLLGLGTCGAIVYLREEIFELLGVEQWLWTGDGYFGSIALSGAVFVLLLAFRVARLVSRASEEDNRIFII